MASEPAPASSHPYTCNTCLIALKSSELQRAHMQSDWHRYNLKRRVASLPPLSSQVFTEKVLANQATAAATAARASFEKLCPACNKVYYSENAYRNHLGSQKHRLKAALLAESQGHAAEDETNSVTSATFSLGEPIDGASVSTAEPQAADDFSEVVSGLKRTSIKNAHDAVPRPSHPRPSEMQTNRAHPLSPVKHDADSTNGTYTTEDTKNATSIVCRCLFCSTESTDIEANVSHMKLKHGMFIPEQNYLVDLQGLIQWLHERISFFHECLYCGVMRQTAQGIQTHMRDKGHCMIGFESEEEMIEVGQFYDFRSTYSDTDDEDEEDDEDSEVEAAPKKHLGGRRKEAIIKVDGDDSYEEMQDESDNDWESDDSGDAEEDDEDGSKAKRRPYRGRVKESTDVRPIYFDEDGLHLPSGRIAGNRAFSRYFRQNLHNYPTPEERANRLAILAAADEEDDGTAEQRSDGTLTSTNTRDSRQSRTVSRANGGLGMMGVTDAKKREIGKQEKRDVRRAQQAQNRYAWGNQRRANHQEHFRDPLLQ